MLFSHVKVSCFRAKAHLVFHWCLYNKTRTSSFVFLFLLSFFIGVSWSENATVPQACSSLRDSRDRENKTGGNWGEDRRPLFPDFACLSLTYTRHPYHLTASNRLLSLWSLPRLAYTTYGGLYISFIKITDFWITETVVVDCSKLIRHKCFVWFVIKHHLVSKTLLARLVNTFYSARKTGYMRSMSVSSANNKDTKNKSQNHHVSIVAIKTNARTNAFFAVTFTSRAAGHTNTIVAAFIRPKSHIAFTLRLILAIQIFSPVPEVVRTAFDSNHFAILVFLQLQREALLTGIACNSWYPGTSPIAVGTFNALIGGGRRGRGCRDGKSEVFNQSRVTAWRVSGWRSAKCPGVSV